MQSPVGQCFPKFYFLICSTAFSIFLFSMCFPDRCLILSVLKKDEVKAKETKKKTGEKERREEGQGKGEDISFSPAASQGKLSSCGEVSRSGRGCMRYSQGIQFVSVPLGREVQNVLQASRDSPRELGTPPEFSSSAR